MARLLCAADGPAPFPARGGRLDGPLLGRVALPVLSGSRLEGRTPGCSTCFFFPAFCPVCAFFVLIFSNTRSLCCACSFTAAEWGAAYFFGPLPTGQLLTVRAMGVLLWLMSIPVFGRLIRESRQQAKTGPRFRQPVR